MHRILSMLVILALATLTSGCATTTSHLTAPLCDPRQVQFDFRFADETTTRDRTIIREALENARDYFPLEFTPTAMRTATPGSHRCQPEAQVGRVSTTVAQDDHGLTGRYSRDVGVRLYLDSDWWPMAEPYQKYMLAYHEAYHWYQSLSVQAHARTWSRGDVLWLVEGSARWAEYDTAIRFGHYSDMYAARAWEAKHRVHDLDELRQFEVWPSGPDGDAYHLFFSATDYLLKHHGGPSALRRYWEHEGEKDDWRSIFVAAFGISVEDFYAEFAASSSG